MSEPRILDFPHCGGCGRPGREVAVLVALPRAKVCEDCVAAMASIVATQAPEAARIKFVDEMVLMLMEPIEVVAKWKEIIAKRNESNDEEGK